MGRKGYLTARRREAVCQADRDGARKIERHIPKGAGDKRKMWEHFFELRRRNPELESGEAYRLFVGRLTRDYAPSSVRTNSDYVWPLVKPKADLHLHDFNKAIDAYSTAESSKKAPRKYLSGESLFEVMEDLEDDQQYIMCQLMASVGARPTDTGRILRRLYTWSRTGDGLTDGYYQWYCNYSKTIRKLSQRRSTPPVPYDWIWPMPKRAARILSEMEEDEFVVKDAEKTYPQVDRALKAIVKRRLPNFAGGIQVMDYRRHYINNVDQHATPGTAHSYTLHANEGMIGAAYKTFDRGNEGAMPIVGQKREQEGDLELGRAKKRQRRI